MLVPLSWLRDFAPVRPTTSTRSSTPFDDLGLVVEGVERVGEGLDGVVVARVLEIGAIPDADKIQLVDRRRRRRRAAAGRVRRVQLRAPATSSPLATVGAVLPERHRDRPAQDEGRQWSNGMLCSAAELRLGDDHGGILVLSTRRRPGTPLTEALGIEPDVVLDLEIDANRPDAMSMAGVARDLAAKLGLPFAMPEPPAPADRRPTADRPSVEIEAPDAVPALHGHACSTGVDHRPVARRGWPAGSRSPACGPINNVVDISNYVMLELGQPTHPYDLDRLPGRRLRRARGAAQGEMLRHPRRRRARRSATATTASSATPRATPVGIGGIMGGASSEIDDATTTCCSRRRSSTPMAIARTSKRLGLRTEASARFERGVDPERHRPGRRPLLRAARRRRDGRPRASSTSRRAYLPSAAPVARAHGAGQRAARHRRSTDDEIARLPRRRSASTSTPVERRACTRSTVPTFRPDVERSRSTSSRRWPATTATRTSPRTRADQPSGRRAHAVPARAAPGARRARRRWASPRR